MLFKIKRKKDGTFQVEYSEFYDFLPQNLTQNTLDQIVKTFKKVGIKHYHRTKTGLTITYTGTFFQILGTILTDLLPHAHNINLNELAKLMTDIHEIRHKNTEFVTEWNPEIKTKIEELGRKILNKDTNPIAI